jgi:peptidoglycan/LPS O-acetylase OafA/YrhL
MSAALESSQHRVAGLDGVRGMACFLVFVYHLRWHANASVGSKVLGARVDDFIATFDVGVSIFFVLSGLLLSIPFWKAILLPSQLPDAKRFFWRRLCRIVPAYYAVLITVYLLRGGTYTFYGAIDCLLHATFLHTFSDSSYYGVYPLLWTIGVEFQFYLLLPLIMGALGWLFRRGGVALAIGALFAGTWALDVATRQLLGAAAPLIPDRFLADHGSAVVSGTVFSHLKLFAFGIGGGLAFLHWKPREAIADIVALCALAALAGLLLVGHEAGWRETSVVGWPLNAALISIFVVSVARSRRFASIFSTRAAVWFGTISYGVYLWHELIQRAVFEGTLPNLFQGSALFAVGGIVSFVVTTVIATLSWRFVERPALHSPYPSRA